MKRVYLCLGILCFLISIVLFIMRKPEPVTVVYSPPPPSTPKPTPQPTPEPTPTPYVPFMQINRWAEQVYMAHLEKGYRHDTGIIVNDYLAVWVFDEPSCDIYARLDYVGSTEYTEWFVPNFELFSQNLDKNSVRAWDTNGLKIAWWNPENIAFRKSKALYRVYLEPSVQCSNIIKLRIYGG